MIDDFQRHQPSQHLFCPAYRTDSEYKPWCNVWRFGDEWERVEMGVKVSETIIDELQRHQPSQHLFCPASKTAQNINLGSEKLF